MLRITNLSGAASYFDQADQQNEMAIRMPDVYSIYLHIPFCRIRCGYCDFNTTAGLQRLIPDYVGALCDEISQVTRSSGQHWPVHTIFFGGGTPSLVPGKYMQQILATLNEEFELLPEAEITLEANPGTVSLDYLLELRRLGVNRLSFGMQSANPEELRLLQREHGYPEVVQAVTWARQAGFDNLNLDLIFGLPGQKLESWQNSLELALRLHPEHLSLYALTVEHGTPLDHWTRRGLVQLPDDDVAADEYEWASERLEAAGYGQYEISNWARIEADGQLRACRHNLQYWRSQPYFGFGAGAHGLVAGHRISNIPGLAAYIARCRKPGGLPFPAGPATLQMLAQDSKTAMQETMMVGLRLTQEGVSQRAFMARFDRRMEDIFGKEIAQLEKVGLLEWAGEGEERLRLTRRGRLLGNQVFMQFVGD